MGCESNPGEYHLRAHMAKAYRKSYAVNPDNPIFLRTNDEEKIPGWLRGRSYVDVTTYYTPVAHPYLELPFDSGESQFAYLCVFNAGEWKPIQWGEIRNGGAVFLKMGTDICYLPQSYQSDELETAGDALILETGSMVRPLIPDPLQTQTLTLSSTTKRTVTVATDGVRPAFFTDGEQYELMYWDRDWVSLGKQTATSRPLVFDNAPMGALFWLVTENSKSDARIFTWEDGHQKWW